ncbi:hypothetical protein Tco_1449375 [Tanacetum coccineum]
MGIDLGGVEPGMCGETEERFQKRESEERNGDRDEWERREEDWDRRWSGRVGWSGGEGESMGDTEEEDGVSQTLRPGSHGMIRELPEQSQKRRRGRGIGGREQIDGELWVELKDRVGGEELVGALRWDDEGSGCRDAMRVIEGARKEEGEEESSRGAEM